MARLPLRSTLEQVVRAINGLLYPSENFSQHRDEGTTPVTADTEFTVTHNLGRLDVEFIWWLDGAGTIYESDRANWTEDTIKLKCTAASRGYVVIVR